MPVEVEGEGGGVGSDAGADDLEARRAQYEEALAKMTPEQRAQVEAQQRMIGYLFQSPDVTQECKMELQAVLQKGDDSAMTEGCQAEIQAEARRYMEQAGAAGAPGAAGAAGAPAAGPAGSDSPTAPDNLTVMVQLLLLVGGFVAAAVGYAMTTSKKRRAAAAAAAAAPAKGSKKSN